MTANTTFKEFVEEKGLNCAQLHFGSPRYRNLVRAFNMAKQKLDAEEDAREFKEVRAKLGRKEQPAADLFV